MTAGMEPAQHAAGRWPLRQSLLLLRGSHAVGWQRLACRIDRLLEPQPGLPLDEYFTPFKDLRFNGEAIIIYHEPNAHTDGDSVVLFRGSDVVSAGDIFTPGGYPFLDLARGGSVQGEIAALNHILELTVPAHTQEGGTYVIPGHGRVCDEWEVSEYRDMLVIIRDRVRGLLKKDATLEQVKQARITADYDDRYGANSGPWTTDMFVEAVYQSLKK